MKLPFREESGALEDSQEQERRNVLAGFKNLIGDTANSVTSLLVLDTWKRYQQRKCYCQWKRATT